MRNSSAWREVQAVHSVVIWNILTSGSKKHRNRHPRVPALKVRLPVEVLGGVVVVFDATGVLDALDRFELHALGQVELPGGLEGQVGLEGPRDFLPVLQQLDADVRRVEATGVADQPIVRSLQPGPVAVHLDLWGTFNFDRVYGRDAEQGEDKCNFHF